MENNNKKTGSTLLEIIIAIGIFIIVSSNIVILYLGTLTSQTRDSQKLRADMYLTQGFEAIRSIRDFNFANVTNGPHGLSKSSNYWVFLGTSDTSGIFTRTALIEDIYRDPTSCAIVSSGGQLDSSSKKATVTITYALPGGNPTSVSASQYITNWLSPTPCGPQADNFSLDTSAVYLSNGNQQVRGFTITNYGISNMVIDKITPTWDNSNLIDEIQIAGSPVWKSSGNVGLPKGKQQPSGTLLDIVDATIIPNATAIVDTINFNHAMNGAVLSLTFTFLDGSTSTISNIQL